jgi:FtsP/CotA-like multicopper oxidase with cupredoxin domain
MLGDSRHAVRARIVPDARSCGAAAFHTGRVTTGLPDEIIAGPDNAKERWAVVAAGAGMTAVCIALMIWAGPVGFGIGIVGTVFFGMLCLPYIVFRALRPAPHLVIRADGLTLNRNAVDHGFIAWSEVADVAVGSLGAYSWVEVTLRDPDAFLRQHKVFRRALLRFNGSRTVGTVRIFGPHLPVSVADAAAMMQARLAASSGGDGRQCRT